VGLLSDGCPVKRRPLPSGVKPSKQLEFTLEKQSLAQRGMLGMDTYKFKTRNPKLETNSNDQKTTMFSRGRIGFAVWNFSDFGFI
jgi:hypothetical protein